MRKIKLIKRKERQRYAVYRVVLLEGNKEVHTEVEVAKTQESLERFIELLRMTGWEVEVVK